jgi:hypothetical protein
MRSQEENLLAYVTEKLGLDLDLSGMQRIKGDYQDRARLVSSVILCLPQPMQVLPMLVPSSSRLTLASLTPLPKLPAEVPAPTFNGL